MPEDMDDSHRLVQTQLAHICRQLAPLRTLAAHLLKKELAARSRCQASLARAVALQQALVAAVVAHAADGQVEAVDDLVMPGIPQAHQQVQAVLAKRGGQYLQLVAQIGQLALEGDPSASSSSTARSTRPPRASARRWRSWSR